MTNKQPEDWREARRLRAWELKQQGWKAARIAEALGVTPGAVSQWFKRVAEEGIQGLYRRKPPGAKPRLTPAELKQLLALLEQGGRGPRVSGRCLDPTSGGQGHPTGVRRHLHPPAGGQHLAQAGLEPAEAGHPG